MLIALLLWLIAAPARADPAAVALVARGNSLYFQGRYDDALAAYLAATKKSSATMTAWLNGAQILEETGRLKDAVRWYARAAALTLDADVLGALGWAQWRARNAGDAARTFDRALRRQPDNVQVLIGAARAAMDLNRPQDAVQFLERASQSAPLMGLIPFYEGQAFEKLNDDASAIDAYKKAVIEDSYFVEGREALGRVYLRKRDYNGAWKQFSKELDAEPHNKRLQLLVDRVQPLLTRSPSELRPGGLHKPIPYVVASPPAGSDVPMIRVGIGTDEGGRPKPRQSTSFKVTTDFELDDGVTGKLIARGGADDLWSARLRKAKKKVSLIVTDAEGKVISAASKSVVIRPDLPAKAVITLDGASGAGSSTAGRTLRGDLEISLSRGNIRLVDIVDLENYTHGVVSAEMPIKSPIEALKAQAVMARTHALYIKSVTRRHKKEGYDICDGDHCQVYGGVRSESERSREVVDATRGMVVTYKGRAAQVIYSSNCGGFTQDAKDVTGWGDVAYWKGVSDGYALGPRPSSPWELRQWLWSSPTAFCKPSNDVHPSHFRWSRVVSFPNLGDKLDKKFRTGKLKGLQVLRRSSSGNVNALLVVGSRKKVKIDSETQIRSLLGVGSLRSTLFVMEVESDSKGRPTTVVFHGGGWGHGVGLCQSGAMGRAEAGQSYAEIIKAYFRGVELSKLKY